MRKNIINLLLILPIAFSCQSKKQHELSNSSDINLDTTSEYIIYELSALSSDRKEIELNMAFQMTFINDGKKLNKKEISDSRYFTKAAVSSHVRAIIGNKPKEELTELRKLHSNIQEEITESLTKLNTLLIDVGTKVSSLDATMRNK